MKLLLAALLGALAFFAWEFVAHTFMPLGEAGLDYLPKSDTVGSSLETAIGAKAGMYMFPTAGLTTAASNAEKQKGMERMMEEMKTKPSGLLVYKPAGTEFNFGKSLAIQFINDLAKALLALALLAQTRLATFGRRVGFVTLVGLLAAITTTVPYWNWYGFNSTFTLANIVMDVAGYFFAGLVIAALYKPENSAISLKS